MRVLARERSECLLDVRRLKHLSRFDNLEAEGLSRRIRLFRIALPLHRTQGGVTA